MNFRLIMSLSQLSILFLNLTIRFQLLIVFTDELLSDITSCGGIPAVLHCELSLSLSGCSQFGRKPEHIIKRYLN
jgi:hypothetical protein